MNGPNNEGDKLRLDLLPPVALASMAAALTFGAKNREDRNWESGLSFGSHYGALQRHANKYWSGERYDEEMGVHHLGAMLANGAVLLDLDMRYAGSEYDDRPTPIPTSCPIHPPKLDRSV